MGLLGLSIVMSGQEEVEPLAPAGGISVPGYDSVIASAADLQNSDQLCALDPSSLRVFDAHGSWNATQFPQTCVFYRDAFDAAAPRGLTKLEVDDAHAWYLSFLVAQFFDSAVLDDENGLDAWLETTGSLFISSETLEQSRSKSGENLEVDGHIFDIGDVVLSGTSEDVFGVIAHNGTARLLALELQGGSLAADYYGLEQNQVRFSGSMSAFYRIEKSRLIEFELRSDPTWSLAALQEQHPEYFDDTKLVLRLDARVDHTLQRTPTGWQITKWGFPDPDYIIGG